ncbi:MAG: hypothetical protein R3B48_21970 [Kofleriaceae bacterium]
MLLLLCSMPLLGGAKGDGCAAGSDSPAPDVRGTWDLTYDDMIGVEVKLGGAVYQAELGANGGTFTITHQGRTMPFTLDCARPEVLCPSEAWPAQAVLEQRNVGKQHQMVVTLPSQQCRGALSKPAPGTCGTGTANPSCDLVCEGEVQLGSREAFGVIGERGDTFRLFLGGGIATNGLNCALLGWSVADASLTTTGSAQDGDWEAQSMDAGLVTVGYSGGCLWAGAAGERTDAVIVGAEVKFTTGFTGTKR